MDFAGYEIYVTSQTLPALEVAWSTVELGDKTFKFKRDTNKTKVFKISGYISKSDWNDTIAEAEGLNNALLTTPSGTFTDGNGATYNCLVDSWEISPVAATNKYIFSMSLRIPTSTGYDGGTYNQPRN